MTNVRASRVFAPELSPLDIYSCFLQVPLMQISGLHFPLRLHAVLHKVSEVKRQELLVAKFCSGGNVTDRPCDWVYTDV